MQAKIYLKKEKGDILKSDYNHVRLVLIRKVMKDKCLTIGDINRECLYELSYDRVKNLFKKPYHVSEDLLGRIEKHLRISSFDILEAFEEAGLSISRAQELGVRIGPED